MKSYVVNASQMKRYDANTIEKFKMPGIVLMERAALVTAEALQAEYRTRETFFQKRPRVLVAAGGGNNGGDGLAVGRLLLLEGWRVDFALIGAADKRSPDMDRQTAILREYGASFFDRIEDAEYDIVIDAIFGVGLSRDVEGEYRRAVEAVNRMDAYVCSIDIPSGINADTGAVMGCAVKADMTVTYGFRKLGQLLYPGASYCGKLLCRDMGIDSHSFLDAPPFWYTHTDAGGIQLPVRRADGNKGTFGKALVIAGNSQIYGAAYLAVKSCFCMGAGMVKAVTARENREALQKGIPEAMLTLYGDDMTAQEEEAFWDAFCRDMEWADCILAGPGMGVTAFAKKMLRFCIEESALPLILDADALNLLAESEELQAVLQKQENRDRTVILTPHMGEFARLYGVTTAEAKAGILSLPGKLSKRLCCTVVCKDARTVVVDRNSQSGFINTTGNEGMATAGSGDVLAGMITGLVAQGAEAFLAASSGVALHGMAGDHAAAKCTPRSMMASDIIEQIPAVMKENAGQTADAETAEGERA